MMQMDRDLIIVLLFNFFKYLPWQVTIDAVVTYFVKKVILMQIYEETRGISHYLVRVRSSACFLKL